ncbi:hypothetical protein AMJ86_08330 [bacterium SM23_57]|nr:MAG: hypothetical protein AMJ86_08330 [bacterium SM23_57]
MHTKRILIAITVLILASLACGIDIDLPITTDIKTGPTVIEEIEIPGADDPDIVSDITLAFGAGELNLSPGNVSTLISGQVTYNVDDLKPEITILNNNITIETGNLEIDGIPNFSDQIKNIWDLKLGTKPLALTIKAGAYSGHFDLGDIPLSNLHIADGASDVEINFSQPNHIQMQSLRYETGASNISLKNLANANFGTLIFESGAGNYELDFSGTLQREASVFIETGLSSLTISVPDSTQTQVKVEEGLSNITSRGSWSQTGNTYTIPGDGHVLTINVEMKAGNLILTTH